MSPQELFGEAIRLEDEGRRELALGLWRQPTATNPTRHAFLRLAESRKNSALALKDLGIIAIRRRDYEMAETRLKKACEIEEDPAGPDSVFSEWPCGITGRPTEAERAYIGGPSYRS